MATLLIVEDEPMCLEALRYYFEERSGHLVIGASNEAEALRLAANSSPDLLMIDAILPVGGDGLRAARRIQERSPDLPVLVVSGLPRYEIERKLGGLRVVRIFTKPVGLDELGSEVDAALKGSAAAPGCASPSVGR